MRTNLFRAVLIFYVGPGTNSLITSHENTVPFLKGKVPLHTAKANRAHSSQHMSLCGMYPHHIQIKAINVLHITAECRLGSLWILKKSHKHFNVWKSDIRKCIKQGNS